MSLKFDGKFAQIKRAKLRIAARNQSLVAKPIFKFNDANLKINIVSACLQLSQIYKISLCPFAFIGLSTPICSICSMIVAARL